MMMFHAPVRFHDTALGMPVDALQKMSDLVDRHVCQERTDPRCGAKTQ